MIIAALSGKSIYLFVFACPPE